MNEIVLLKEKTEEKKHVESQLKKARQDQRQLKNKLTILTTQLKKEFEDVKKLEGNGLSSMFYSLLGNKDEKLFKERQEYLSAKLKYDSCKNELEKLSDEIIKLEKQLKKIGNPEITLKAQLEQRSAQLKESGDSKLLKYEELLQIYYAQKKEINESIAAGEKALSGLRNATQLLRKAKNWGTYDMIGGGLIATAVKHSKMDDARTQIHHVQTSLNRFRRELSDIKSYKLPDMNIQLDSFTAFADYFFDNLITDWVVQSKINRSLDGCNQVYNQVLDIVTKLRVADVDVTKKYRNTREELNNYIVRKEI